MRRKSYPKRLLAVLMVVLMVCSSISMYVVRAEQKNVSAEEQITALSEESEGNSASPEGTAEAQVPDNVDGEDKEIPMDSGEITEPEIPNGGEDELPISSEIIDEPDSTENDDGGGKNEPTAGNSNDKNTISMDNSRNIPAENSSLPAVRTSGTDITDQITFSGELLEVYDWIDDNTGVAWAEILEGVQGHTFIAGQYRFSFDWEAYGSGYSAGDYFTFKIPTGIESQQQLPMTSPDGESWGTIVVDAAGNAKATFNENVAGKINIGGGVRFGFQYLESQSGKTVTWEFNLGTSTYKYNGISEGYNPGEGSDSGDLEKDGVNGSDADENYWQILLNSHQEEWTDSLTIHDDFGGNYKIVPVENHDLTEIDTDTGCDYLDDWAEGYYLKAVNAEYQDHAYFYICAVDWNWIRSDNYKNNGYYVAENEISADMWDMLWEDDGSNTKYTSPIDPNDVSIELTENGFEMVFDDNVLKGTSILINYWYDLTSVRPLNEITNTISITSDDIQANEVARTGVTSSATIVGSRGKISLFKQNSNETQLFSNIDFKLSKENTIYTITRRTNDQGKLTLDLSSNLNDDDYSGTYILQEEDAPNGYETMKDITLAIASNGEITKVNDSSIPENKSSGTLVYGQNAQKVCWVSRDRLSIIVYNQPTPKDTVNIPLTATKTLTGVGMDFEFESGMFNFAVVDKNNNDKEISTASNGIPDVEGNASIAFNNIQFNAPGIYSYAVKEIAGNIPGIVYDTTEYPITFTVKESGETLTATITSPSAEIVFNNAYYAASIPVTLTAAKVFTDLTAGAPGTPKTQDTGMFNFIVEDKDGVQKTVGSNLASGEIKFGSITFAAPGTYNYFMREVDGQAPGIKYDSTKYPVTIEVVDNSGILVATVKYPDGASNIVFTNTYHEYSTSVALTAEKILTGWSGGLTAGMFSFVIEEENGETKTIKASGTNDGNGNITFSEISFDTPGTYTYYMREIDGNVAGFAYDATKYRVKIEVSNASGALTAVCSYFNSDGSPILGTTPVPVFQNTYHATDTSVILTAKKIYTDLTDDTTSKDKALDAGMFSFIIVDEAGETKATGTNDKDGNITFGMLPFSTPGIYNYFMKEVDGKVTGINYDATAHPITITVVDDSGSLVASVEYPYHSPTSNIVFTNSYHAKHTSVTLEAKKKLTGATLTAGRFGFIVVDKKGDTVATATNDGGNEDGIGNITFNAIHLDKPGTYVYTIMELNKNEKGINYDNSSYRVTVEVKDNMGTLEATVKYPEGSNTSNIQFNNTYHQNSTSILLTAEKKLTGGTLEAGKFSFILKDKNGNTVATASNEAPTIEKDTGTITFGPIYYSVPGTYNYTIEEVDNGVVGVRYDTTQYPITVKVTDDGEDNLIATAIYPQDEITFNNSYHMNSIPVTLKATKSLVGTPLADNMFSFVVTDASNKIVATGTNEAGSDGKGAITFSDIYINELGIYTYTMKEVNSSARATGSGQYTYDDTGYQVEVEIVVDPDDDNKLKAGSITYLDSSTEFRNSFSNTYTSFTLAGTKLLKGKPLEDDMFNFFVKDKSNNTVTVGKNKKDGSIVFGNIYVTLPGTYEYTVTEMNGNAGGITYDNTSYPVTAVVTQDSSGVLTAKVNNPPDGDSIVFNNSYKASSTSLALTATKKLTGKPLEDNMFSFEVLDKADGKVKATGSNKADGTITFGKINFNEPGTFTYKVQEVDGGVGGIVYDKKEFDVSVTVTDNGDGTLTATPTYPPDGIVFQNSYITSSQSVTLKAFKSLTGGILEDKLFSFVVVDENGTEVASANNQADGSVTFGDIDFTAPGTYTYTVMEVNSNINEITYDDTKYKVEIAVVDNGNGTLTATTAYPEGGINFKNTTTTVDGHYRETVQITATKVFSNMVLEKDMFSFVLKDENGNTMAAATNEADGNITFGRFGFDEAGTYTYTVTEVAGKASGITYDDTKYKVTVNVVDNGDGALTVTPSYPEGGIIFHNSGGEPKQGTTATLTANKNLTGKTLEEGMFSFVVEDKNGKTVVTATNKADGTITFGTIGFDKAGTYTYTMKEITGNADGIVYDGKEHTITVKVVENGDGTLAAIPSYPKGKVIFHNSFGDSVTDSKSNTTATIITDTIKLSTGDENALIKWLFLFIGSISVMSILITGNLISRKKR